MRDWPADRSPRISRRTPLASERSCGLQIEAKKALADPAMKARLAEQGIVAVGNTPDEFRGFVADEIAKWAKVIKDANIKMTE